MGKGTRKRESAENRRAEAERLEAARRKEHKRNVIVGVVSAVAAVAILGGAIFGIWNNKRINSNDYQIHHTIAAKSKNYKVTKAMMTYFTASTYMNYCSNYEDQLEDLGLDTSKDLSLQPCAYDDSITWHDYFVDTTKDTVTWMLSFAEQARADGVELTQEYKDLMKETLDATKPENFGEDLTLDDVQACLELYYMAVLQEEKVRAANVATEENINAWADKNNKTLLRADYTYYNIPYGTGAYYADEAAARAMADRLLNSTEEEFIATAKAELLARGVYANAETLEAQFASNYLRNDYAYREDDGFSDWLFAADTKAGDTKLVERAESRSLAVYLCRTAASRDSEPVVDVRHILFTEETYESDEAAKAKAEEVLKTWQDGEATAESFGALAKEFTEDSNADKGGLYEGVTQGQMVQTFNDWCFDTTRKTGDTGIVKTDYGYHVMYFVKSYDRWYLTAKQTIESESYQATSDTYKAAYGVTVDETVADTVVFA
ncbi:MAG: hypothetical protein E7552_06495 [Ruminococcaceae bacterium]|nr:hypothetical protein [Oscillospiraceae bacterium]